MTPQDKQSPISSCHIEKECVNKGNDIAEPVNLEVDKKKNLKYFRVCRPSSFKHKPSESKSAPDFIFKEFNELTDIINELTADNARLRGHLDT